MKKLANYKMSKNKKISLLHFYREKNKVCKISKKIIISKDKIFHPNSKAKGFYKIKS
jgi:hypothetical protein